MRVLICGGGTGGHIYPALSVVTALKEKGLSDEDFLWIGTHGEIEESLVPRYGLRLETIAGGAIVGVPWRKRLANATKLTRSLIKVNRMISRFRPEVLLMTGGYVNGPVGVSAWLRRIPSAIYLPDIEPGLAVRTMSRLVNRVACTAEASGIHFPRGKTTMTGYPVRSELRQAAEMSKEEALGRFALTAGRPTLFVFGGSRGARSINRGLMSVLADLLEKIQIIHISGELDWDEVSRNADQMDERLMAYYHPYPYLHDEMGAAFRAADLVVARAGASMLGECPAFGLPAVLVPYPHAWRYQKVNADYLVDRGAAVHLADEELPARLAPTILDLIRDENRLQQMSVAARALDVPDSALKIGKLLLELGRERSHD